MYYLCGRRKAIDRYGIVGGIGPPYLQPIDSLFTDKLLVDLICCLLRRGYDLSIKGFSFSFLDNNTKVVYSSINLTT